MLERVIITDITPTKKNDEEKRGGRMKKSFRGDMRRKKLLEAGIDWGRGCKSSSKSESIRETLKTCERKRGKEALWRGKGHAERKVLRTGQKQHHHVPISAWAQEKKNSKHHLGQRENPQFEIMFGWGKKGGGGGGRISRWRRGRQRLQIKATSRDARKAFKFGGGFMQKEVRGFGGRGEPLEEEGKKYGAHQGKKS